MIKTISDIDFSSAMRRAPAQQRSKEKVKNILKAADRLLAEQGYEALVQSPWPIVEASGVTAGVFYNYFENGEAVLEALSLLYFEQARLLADELAAESFDHWETVIDTVNDRFAEFYGQPSVRELWLNDRLTQTAKAAGKEANDHIHATIVSLVERASGGKLQFSPTASVVFAQLGDKMLRFAFEHSDGRREELMAEIKRAMKAYAALFLSD